MGTLGELVQVCCRSQRSFDNTEDAVKARVDESACGKPLQTGCGRVVAGNDQVRVGCKDGPFKRILPYSAIWVMLVGCIGLKQRMTRWRPDADSKTDRVQCQSQTRACRPGLSGKQQNVWLCSGFKGVAHTRLGPAVSYATIGKGGLPGYWRNSCHP
jgi:hypothetical protein